MTAHNDQNAIDKLDLHHRQQLSALMDGELVADEARFLLRRMQHDRDLGGCWERWQLCGEVLRGQALAPAPAGFAERVAHAVAAESTAVAMAARTETRASRGNLLARWGGGALAASVALVALFMARQQSPQETPATADTQVASQQSPSPVPASAVAQTPAAPAPDAEAYAAAAAAVAVASVPRRQDNAARRSATRTQQAARSAQRVARAQAPVRMNAPPAAGGTDAPLVAGAALHAQTVANPFSRQPQDSAAPPARPWPRSTLSGYPAASGTLTTGYTSDSAARTFYPFEPRMPATPPVSPPETATQE